MIGALYGNALSTGHGLHAIYPDGRRVVLPVGSWNGGVELPGDRSLLGRCWGPTLDVGCGPGRLLVALGVRGVPAAGIDPSEEAVALARRAGGTAVCRSVFAPLPGEGLWSCAVLADGTIGIGGAPVRLLSRVRELLGTDGRVLVELDPPASPSGPVRLRLA